MSSREDGRAYAHTTGYGCFFKVAGLMLLLLLLCTGGVGGCFFVRQAEFRKQLTDATNRIRSAGEPLDGAELNTFYAVADGERDRTALYVRAIAPFADNSPYHKDVGTLPVVGNNPQNPPPPGSDWPELSQVEAFLARHQQIAGALHEAGAESGSVRYRVDFRAGIATLLPHAQQVRGAARFLDLEASARMHHGDHAGATQSLICELRVGESLSEEPLIISQLVRIAVFSIFAERLKEYLVWGEATEGELARLQAAVAEVDIPHSFTRAMQGERAIAYQTILTSDMQDIDSMGGQPSGMPLGSLTANQSLANLRPGDSAMMLTLLTEMVEASKHEFPKAGDEAAAVDARMKQFFADDQQRFIWDRHMLTQLLLPAITKMVQSTMERVAAQRVVLATLAVERYRLKHGKLPEKLSDLVPDLLEAVPVDPADGQPLRYRVLEKGFVVYSVGPDKQDDQGDAALTSQKGRDLGMKIER
jgi:hypothetical protein